MAPPASTAPTGTATPPPAATASVDATAEVKTPPPPAVDQKDPKAESAYQPAPKFRLGLDATYSPWARLGGPEGNIFGHDFSAANEGWDHTLKRLGGTFGWKIWDPSPFFQLWLQGQAAYRNYSGNKNTPGELQGFDIGAGPCVASVGLYQKKNDRIITGPELCGALSFMYLTGDSTAGNNFSVDKTSGPGYGISATLSPIGFNVLGLNLSPYVGLDTANIPNARDNNNAPFFAFPTFGIKAAGSVGKAPPPPEECKASDSEEMIKRDAPELKTLRENVTNSLTNFKATADALKAAGYTPEKMRDMLRQGYVKLKLDADKAKAEADIKAKTPDIKPADLKKQTDEAVKTKEEAYKGEAAVVYPDAYDYYNIALPPMDTNLDEAIRIANDGTCSAEKKTQMRDLYDKINNERIALEKTATQIDERNKALLMALGNPGVNKIIKNLGGLAFAQFPPVNFNSGRPDYPGKFNGDMAKLESFLAANKGRAPLDPKDPGLQAAYKGIFAGNELMAIERFSKQLNGIETLRGVKMKGVSEEELKQLVRSVPVIIQGHTSYTDGTAEGNMTLSNNRARAVAIALILFGTDESRLRTEGKGITEPIVPETDDWTPTGKKVKNLTWAQEKNRRIMLLVDVDKLEQSGNAAAAPASKPTEAPKEAPKASKVPALVPTGSAPSAPPPSKGSGVE
jgi:OmpA family protein